MIIELICGIYSAYNFFKIIDTTRDSSLQSKCESKEQRVAKCTQRFKYFIENIYETMDDETFRNAYLDFLRQEGISLIKFKIDNGYYNRLIKHQIENKFLATQLNTFDIFKPANTELKKDLKRFKKEIEYEKYKTI